MDNYRDYEPMGTPRKAGKIYQDRQNNEPEFLRTLTVLTFVGAGLVMLLSLGYILFVYVFSSWTPPQAGRTSFAFDKLDSLHQAKMIYHSLLLVSCVLCIIGAGLMRKFREAGFWIYIAGQGFHLFGLILLFNTTDFKHLTFQIFNFALCAAFTVMYFYNKKYLNS